MTKLFIAICPWVNVALKPFGVMLAGNFCASKEDLSDLHLSGFSFVRRPENSWGV